MILLLATLAWAEPEVEPTAEAPPQTPPVEEAAPADVPSEAPPDEAPPEPAPAPDEAEPEPPAEAPAPEQPPVEAPDPVPVSAPEPPAPAPEEVQAPPPPRPFLRFGPPWAPAPQDGHDDPHEAPDGHDGPQEAPDGHDEAPEGHDDAHDGHDDPQEAPDGHDDTPDGHDDAPDGHDDAQDGHDDAPDGPEGPDAAEPEPSVGPSPGGWLLPVPHQSSGSVVTFLIVMAVSSIASTVARATRRRLRPGAIAGLLRVADTLGRILLVVAGLGLVTQLMPKPLLPALPWATLAGALAVGWSLRDALPDLVAWTQLSAEGSVRRGQWVRGEGFNGRVERIGLRATWLADDRGQRVSVPNRLLVQGTMRTDKERWYVTEVELDLPDVEPARARRAIQDACMLSPWVAPDAQVDVRWDPVRPSRWSLRVQLLEGGFADPFRGALRERVEELLRPS